MGYTKVNLQSLIDTATAWESYLQYVKQQLRDADQVVDQDLGAAWSGEDYNSFIEKWNQRKEKDSIEMKMLGAINGYSKCLKTAATKYIQAQRNAHNRANSYFK